MFLSRPLPASRRAALEGLEPRRPAGVLVSRAGSRRNRHRRRDAGHRRLSAGRNAGGEVLPCFRAHGRDLRLFRRRAASRAGTVRVSRGAPLAGMERGPLHLALAVQLPLRGGQRHGPRCTAPICTPNRTRWGGGDKDARDAGARDRARADIREDQPARRQFRLGRVRRYGSALDAALDSLPAQRGGPAARSASLDS